MTARLHALRNIPFVDMVPLAAQAVVRRVVRQLFIPGIGVMGANRIGEHHDVFGLLMLEIIVDPFLFHEPADEIEIGLTILHAVFPGAILAAERFFIVGKAMIPAS